MASGLRRSLSTVASIAIATMTVFTSLAITVLAYEPMDGSDADGGPDGRDFWPNASGDSRTDDIPLDTPGVIGPVTKDVWFARLNISTDGLVSRVPGLEGLSTFEGVAHHFRDGLGSRGFTRTKVGLSASSSLHGALSEGQVAIGGRYGLLGSGVVTLDAGGGLVVIDMADPSVPRPMSLLPLYGSPDELVLFGSHAYVLVDTFAPAWYDVSQDSGGTRWGVGECRAGSRLVIVNLTEPSHPWIERNISIEGFASAECRVGSQLYIISNCYGWYRSTDPDESVARTEVLAIDLADHQGPRLEGILSIDGYSSIAHLGQGALYIMHHAVLPSGGRASNGTISRIDMADAHPGQLAIASSAFMDGNVGDASWVDEWEGRLYVVTDSGSEYGDTWINVLEFPGVGTPSVRTGEPFRDGRLGWLVYDGDRLVVVGNQAYAINEHLTGIDVLTRHGDGNVSVSDHLIVPGEYAQVVYTGDELLVAGGEWGINGASMAMTQVHIDGTGTPHLVQTIRRMETVPDMVDRCSTSLTVSGVSWDPLSKVAVVPYVWEHSEQISPGGSRSVHHGEVVVIVPFDDISGRFLEAGNVTVPYQDFYIVGPLTFFGRYALNLRYDLDHVRVLSFEDPSNPSVDPVVGVVPWLLDARCINGSIVRLVDLENYYDPNKDGIELWIDPLDDIPSLTSSKRIMVAKDLASWFFNGDLFHAVEVGVDPAHLADPWAIIRTVDLSEPGNPVVGEALNVTMHVEQDIGGLDIYDMHHLIRPGQEEGQNPMLVEGKAIVLVSGGAVYIFDVSNATRPQLVKRCVYDYGFAWDIRMVGRTLYITSNESRLHRLDLQDPWRPKALPVVWIPGMPVDADPSSDLLITVAEWESDVVGFYGTSLSAVRIDGKEATIVWAIDVSRYWYLVEDGIAVLLDPNNNIDHAYERYGYGYTVNTTVLLVGLGSASGPRLLSALEVTGGLTEFHCAEGVLVLSESSHAGRSGTILFDGRDPANVRPMGIYEPPGHFQYEDRYLMAGDVLLIVRCDFGLIFLDVST